MQSDPQRRAILWEITDGRLGGVVVRSSSACCVGTHPPKIDDNLLSFGGLVTSYRTGFITHSNLRQSDITLESQVISW